MSCRKIQQKRAELAVRDGWLCCFCGEGIDPTLARPHPMHATLHHVVAVADGGGDELENLALAHERCHQDHHNPKTEREAA
jgi:5-methylcytosine-specific restriction endonuclease McrA